MNGQAIQRQEVSAQQGLTRGEQAGINYYDLLKDGPESFSGDWEKAVSMIVSPALRGVSSSHLPSYYEAVEETVYNIIFEPSREWEERRVRFVREAEKSYPSSLSKTERSAYVLKCLRNLVSEKRREASRKSGSDSYRVHKEVERYLRELEGKGVLSRVSLGRVGFIWFPKEWTQGQTIPHIRRREPRMTLEDLKLNLDVIPAIPIDQDAEEGDRSRPVFEYGKYLPERIYDMFGLYGAPLHTAEIKNVVEGITSRSLNAEYLYRDLEETERSLKQASSLTPEEHLLKKQEGDLETQLVTHPSINDRQRNIWRILKTNPGISKTRIADILGCSRNTVIKDMGVIKRVAEWVICR